MAQHQCQYPHSPMIFGVKGLKFCGTCHEIQMSKQTYVTFISGKYFLIEKLEDLSNLQGCRVSYRHENASQNQDYQKN